MSLVIITQSPERIFFSIEVLKGLMTKILKRNRGPHGVTKSLLRGLKELNEPYQLNPPIETIKPGDVLWVNESLQALEYLTQNKPSETKLVAGPNLVITPLDHQEILCNDAIDIVIEPSLWVKNFIISLRPNLENKIAIWPAGVEIPQKLTYEKTIDTLIYVKNSEESVLVEDIQKKLTLENKTFVVFTYGEFKQETYFEKLNASKSLMYIGKSESQGLALQEAWVRDIPTLVLKQTQFTYKTYSFEDPTLAAPYLSDTTGMFFTKKDYLEAMNKFFNSLSNYKPREYVIENLSDVVCAQKFLSITKN